MNPREYTCRLLEMVEEGLITADDALMACVKFMSEDEVKEMMRLNELMPEEVENV